MSSSLSMCKLGAAVHRSKPDKRPRWGREPVNPTQSICMGPSEAYTRPNCRTLICHDRRPPKSIMASKVIQRLIETCPKCNIRKLGSAAHMSNQTYPPTSSGLKGDCFQPRARPRRGRPSTQSVCMGHPQDNPRLVPLRTGRDHPIVNSKNNYGFKNSTCQTLQTGLDPSKPGGVRVWTPPSLELVG